MPMTGTEGAALAEIKRLEKAGALRYDWNHAIPRMEERGATRADVPRSHRRLTADWARETTMDISKSWAVLTSMARVSTSLSRFVTALQ